MSITTTEAAARLGVSDSYVRRLIREERLDGERFGPRVWMVTEESVERYKRERRAPGRPRSEP